MKTASYGPIFSADNTFPGGRRENKMNSVTLTGRLVTKPKLAPTDKGRPVCDVRLLVDNGLYPAFKIDVSVFDGAAHTCAEER